MLKSGELSKISDKATVDALRQRIKQNLTAEDFDVVAHEILDFKRSISLGETNKEGFCLNDHEVLRCLDLLDEELFPYLRYRYEFKRGARAECCSKFPVHLLIEPVIVI
jgi:hypothetical protein